MKLFSAKVTTVSFVAAAALGAAALAFAGCTVTGGTVDNDGGPAVDTGSPDAPVATCEGNKQAGSLVSAACQSCLNAKCCTELKGCFNATVIPDAGGTEDCNEFSKCISFCYEKAQPQACLEECAAAAGDGIPDRYQDFIDCAKAKGCETLCNLQDAPQPDAGTDSGTDSGDAADQ